MNRIMMFGAFLLIIGAVAAVAVFGSSFLSIYPQQTPITYKVFDSQGNLVPGADIYWFNSEDDPAYQYMLNNPQTYPNPLPPPNQWVYFGTTDQYGYFIMIGYSGQQVKAVLGSVEAFATTTNNPICTITLPIFVGQTAQPTPTPTPVPTASPAPTYTTTFTAMNLPEGLKWGLKVDANAPTYTTTKSITVTVTSGLHQMEVVNPLGYTADASYTQFSTYQSGGVYNIPFYQVSETDMPAPQTQTVTLTVDKATVNRGETVYFTVGTNPALAGKTCTLKAYVDGEQVVFTGVEGGQTAFNGMVLLNTIPSSVTDIYGGNTVTWKATVNGVESNTVTTTVNTDSSSTPIPDETTQNTLWQAIIDFFSFRWLTDLFK